MPSPSRFPALAGLVSTAFLSLALTGPAAADRIRNPTAVFAGLDKITGRIISFEVAVDETVQFGALQLTPRVCWTRPPTEAPQTTSFTEVDEVTFKNEYRRIFTGWMYAASPGMHGVEHAIYDVWLTDCKGGTELVVDPKEPEAPIPDEPRRPRNPARDVNQQPGLPPHPAAARSAHRRGPAAGRAGRAAPGTDPALLPDQSRPRPHRRQLIPAHPAETLVTACTPETRWPGDQTAALPAAASALSSSS